MKHSTLAAIITAIAISLAAVIPAYPALAAPAISVSPDVGAAGTRVELSGTDFDSYVGDNLSIFFDDQEVASSPVQVLSGGQLQVYFDVPDDATSGVSIVSVRGPFDSVLAATTFTVPLARIELDTVSTKIGGSVTATGEGFYADNYINFVFAYDGTEISLGSTLSGPTGQYQHEFTVPVSPAGVKQIIARDDKGNLALAGLEVVPSAIVNPVMGVHEDIIDIVGIGFSSESFLAISFGTTMAVAHDQANTTGSFEGTFAVPELASGIYDLSITDINGYSALLQFTVTSGIKLNRTTGNIGTPVIVSGTGFAAEVTISIYYDGVGVALATTDELGSFSATFEVPVSVSGEHTVSATVGSTVRELVFSVESEPPPAPKRLQPTLNNEELPSTGFIWEPVGDDSQPVTYVLQIAADEQFTDVVLEKTGLVSPKYTLTGADQLPSSVEGEPYYWRVKAVDAASNEGEWSTVGSFYWTSSSLLPLWAIIILIAAGLMIVGFLIYWTMIRREASYEED